MSNQDNRNSVAGWAVGGGVLVGLGVGFFFLHRSALYFTGSLIAGVGAGLIVAAVISRDS